MGGIFDSDAYAPSFLSLPYLLVTMGLLALLVACLFILGNPVVRMSMMALVAVTLPWAVGQVVTASCTDPDIVERLSRATIGPLSLVGPAVFALVLGIGNQLHQHRGVLALGIGVATLSCVICWTTDLMIRAPWQTSWGLWYPRAGPLNELHVANIGVWAVVGAALSARSLRRDISERLRVHYKRALVMLVVIVLGTTDTLLTHGIGVYPMSWIAALAALGLGLHGIFRADLLRSRGLDRAVGWEMIVVLGLAGAVYGAYAAVGHSTLATLAALTVLVAVAHALSVIIRQRVGGEGPGQTDSMARAVDEYGARLGRIRRHDELAAALRDFLETHLRLTRVRLLVADETGLSVASAVATSDAAEAAGAAQTGAASEAWRLAETARLASTPIDARVKAWLVANRQPLLAEFLDAQRLGGLRAPIQSFLAVLDAELVVPLVDREIFVGLIATGPRRDDRALRGRELAVLAQVQQLTGAAATYVNLYQAAEKRVAVAREVEIAAAVERSRVAGQQRATCAGCEIVSYYEPAGRFGGDWWVASELPDGRLLIAIGDVSGHGVPAALVTATVEGSCETAQDMLGASIEVLALLKLLNRAVLDVGRGRYLMTCFVAVFDLEEGSITFANAGHTFPYLCRPPGPGVPPTRRDLGALVSRGLPLGVEAEPVITVSSRKIRRGDIAVFYTDALIDSANADGARYGNRRFQRALRSALPAADRFAEVVMDQVRDHYGKHAPGEDITLVCVRAG
jgi:serine phosphatase RsbU (regulator of sigma subunit)